MNSSSLLSVRALSKTYRVGLQGCTASARALDRVDLEIARGEVVAVVGPRSAGKTTLLHSLAGLLSPDEGRIERHRTDDGRGITTRYVQGPIELARLRASGEHWDIALVDNVELVHGDVAGAFALLAAARHARAKGIALVMAARDPRSVSHLADRVMLIESGRLHSPSSTRALSGTTRVAEATVRLGPR